MAIKSAQNYLCKFHNKAHQYVKCACGHQYCALYWRDCPRCHGESEANIIEPPAHVPMVFTCPNCKEAVSGPANYCGMLKCVWCHTAFEQSTED